MVRLSSFDVYPKTLQEFRERTLTGAVISLVCAVLIVLLAGIELADFLTVKKSEHLFVDTSRGKPLQININITFPALPCSVISLDTLDVSGNHVPDVMRHITKSPLDQHGGRLPQELPNTAGRPAAAAAARRLLAAGHGVSEEEFEDGRAAVQMLKTNLVGKPDALLSKLLAELLPSVFEDKGAIEDLRKHLGEGCHIEGHLLVNKVAGHFHFALQKADHHVLMTVFKRRDALNVSHLVHSISFGEPYPGMRNPLDGQHKVLNNGSGFFQYYIKVVPTIYEPLGAAPLHTNQYSYTELFRTTQELEKLPAVYFHYELSPIMARTSEERRAFSNLLTGLCAVVGGVFTVASMVDSSLHALGKRIKKGEA